MPNTRVNLLKEQEVLALPEKTKLLEALFILLRTKKNSNGCLVWTGSLTGEGYAKIHFKKQMHLVHRLIYLLTEGEIPFGYEIDHGCRNKACINTQHLEAVTVSVNQKRTYTIHSRGIYLPLKRKSRKQVEDAII